MADESKEQQAQSAESSSSEPAKEIEIPVPAKQAADRPHWITIALGLLSPSIAIVAVLFSMRSLQTSQEALTLNRRSMEFTHEVSQESLALNRRSMELAQSAWVTASFYSESQKTEHAGAIWHLGAALNNTGNTPATVSNILVNNERFWKGEKGVVTLMHMPKTTIIGGKEVYKLRLGDYFSLNEPPPTQVPGGPIVVQSISSTPLGKLSLSFDYEDVFGHKKTVSVHWNLAYSDGQLLDITGYMR
jgi:hypothetical protein